MRNREELKEMNKSWIASQPARNDALKLPRPTGEGWGEGAICKPAFTLAEVFLPHSAGCRRAAFTLAEVLITLGIIGVVAAMTMPTLITKYQEKALETQIAKAKTTLANGYKLMMARNDDLKIENLPIFTECTDLDCVSKHHKDAFSIVADSLSMNADTLPEEYAIWASTEKSPFKWQDVDYMFMTGDGMVYGFVLGEDQTTFDIVADVNGSKNPNVAVKDLRKFRFSGEGGTLFDVSEELTEQGAVCSVETLENCLTPEACMALPETICDENGDNCLVREWHWNTVNGNVCLYANPNAPV